MPSTPALTARLAAQAMGPLFRFIGASLVAIASFALVMSWHSGPQRLIDAQRAQRFTVHKEGHIVESWVALALDPSAMGTSTYWRGFARSYACVIVEYDAEWGPARRGFCGPLYGFTEKTTVHDLIEVSAGVPFDFARDASGFRVPEIRMSEAAWDYLASHPPIWSSRKATTALDEVRRDLDRPVDGAISSWSSAPPAFPLAIESGHPADPLPAGLIAARRNAEPEWAPAIIATVVGLAFWWVGMNLLFMNLSFAVRTFFTVLPLLALPWWAQELPNALRHVNRYVADTVAETLGDITAAGAMEAGDPAGMRLRGGKALKLGVTEGVYAETIGRLRFTAPQAPLATGDAALAALSDATTRQVRQMPASERAALFDRLKRDKADGLPYAGIVFLHSAKEALLDPGSAPELQAAARGFLSEWVTSPVLLPRPGEPAFERKLASFRELLDIPVTEIAYSASMFLEQVEKTPRRKP